MVVAGAEGDLEAAGAQQVFAIIGRARTRGAELELELEEDGARLRSWGFLACRRCGGSPQSVFLAPPYQNAIRGMFNASS